MPAAKWRKIARVDCSLNGAVIFTLLGKRDQALSMLRSATRLFPADGSDIRFMFYEADVTGGAKASMPTEWIHVDTVRAGEHLLKFDGRN